MTGNDVNRTMSPDEYSELKRQEKAEVFDLLSDATQKLLSPDRLKEYADKQAQFFNHSVSNVLLIMEQNPEATWVRSYDDWKADGVTVLKGEKGIRTLSSYRFQKEDGTMGMVSKVVKMFDVKQTAIREIIDAYDLSYERIWMNFNRTDMWVLQRLAAHAELQTGEYRTSTIYSALKRLQHAGHVIYTDRFELEDPFFGEWLVAKH